MIDIPINKALVVVEVTFEGYAKCTKCCLAQFCYDNLGCSSDYRKDGKNVIFKLADWPGEEER